MRRNFATLAMLGTACLLLAGCITPYPDLTQSRSPCRNEPGGWCDFVRDVAAESYPYAMLSANAYQDGKEYTALPAAFEQRAVADDGGSGLAYAVFDRFTLNEDGTRGDLAARVIAFRGTDFGSTSDIIQGSLRENQIRGARAAYSSEREALDQAGMSDITIEATGHSLGGALATQLSIDNPGLRAFIFNASPFFIGDPGLNDANRISVSERGEFLRLLSRYKAPPAAASLVLNCNPSSGAGSKHSIRSLGDCLTWIAAYDDAEALTLLRENMIEKPEVECDANRVHPGFQSTLLTPGEVRAPCIHSPKQAEQG